MKGTVAAEGCSSPRKDSILSSTSAGLLLRHPASSLFYSTFSSCVFHTSWCIGTGLVLLVDHDGEGRHAADAAATSCC